MQHMRNPFHASTRWPLLVLAAAFMAGSIAALLGSYWDDAWHTNRGRDEFLIAPHITLYAGVLLAGGSLALWAGWRVLDGGLAALRSDRALALVALGVGATLGSAPIDSAWHAAFGRDAVLWSPPHALGIIGLIGLSVAMLSLLADIADRWAFALRTLVSGLVVGGAVFMVAEYETRVPQFDEFFYPPVLALAGAFAFELVRMIVGGRWPATLAALAHLALIALASAFLVAATGWEPPLLPLLVGPALALDLGARRDWSDATRAAGFVAVLYLLYVPYVDGALGMLELAGSTLALGFVVSFAAVFALLRLLRKERGGSVAGPMAPGAPAPAACAVAIVAVTLALAPPAPAHDPGQGEELASAQIAASSDGGRATLVATVADPALCPRLEARALVARRAGRTRRAPLERQGCELRGSIALPEQGLWFLYAELSLGDRKLESWLPIEVDSGTHAEEGQNRSLYVVAEKSPGALQILAGFALYSASLALVAMIVRLAAGVGAQGRRRPEPFTA